MSERHVLNELSAYLDGEARDPERIARHLQHCPHCARRHLDMLKLSAQVQALHPPQHQPNFVSRVLQEIQTQEQAAPRWRLRWAFPALAAAASLLLVLGLSLYVATLQEENLTVPEIAVGGPTPQQWTHEAFEAELARMVDAGVDISLFEPVGFAPAETADLPGIDFDDVVAVLADASADLDYPEFDPEPFDVQSMLETMSPGEWTSFRELVQEYLSEG